MAPRRFESSVTALSWIPSEAIEGLSKIPFELGITHYDEPPPDKIDDLEELRLADRYREANELRAYIEVDDGRITGHGYLGGGRIGSTTVRFGPARVRFPGFKLPDIQQDPEVGPTSVRFVQTIGGRMGLPTPRPVKRRPYAQFWPSIAWSTLELVIDSDGTSRGSLIGASPFPRHWVYDDAGKLAAKVGLTDFKEWWRHSFGKHTPWGDETSKAYVTAVETALERQLSTTIMRGGAKPEIRKVKKGKNVVTQGEEGNELFLVLNGVVSIIVDDEPLAELGPGAVLGERAVLEGGKRTSTVQAVTDVKVAVASPDQIERSALEERRPLVGADQRR